MRTNIELDDKLVQQAQKLSNIRTKREVVKEALKNYVAFLKKQQILSLKGKIIWQGDLKQMRGI